MCPSLGSENGLSLELSTHDINSIEYSKLDSYFVCLDTGASSHSHPELKSLSDTVDCLETKYTGGGPSESKLEGAWQFSLTDVK